MNIFLLVGYSYFKMVSWVAISSITKTGLVISAAGVK